ncbi:helix-turn-helix domain-containing protein [Olivibacter sitiensis]|uniref:helix-turn-helix domain-containing protein n=1 Tax=Olivibacter sitiensis TaxID=376470 RepID=UPI0003FCFE3B|nr:helix-turn-helix domain-containing protein [Olivibacter sitiensis]
MRNIATHNLYESLKKKEDVDQIEHEIYLYETTEIQRDGYRHPLKTDCTICCICLKGELKGKIDLKEYSVQAPALAISLPGQILEHESCSDDFHGILIYMTQRFTEKFNLLLGHSISTAIKNRPYMALRNEELQSITAYCKTVRKVIRTDDNPHRLQIITHLTIAYFYGIGYFLHKSIKDVHLSKDKDIADRFLQKVRQHYKTERKVEYYAVQLQLSANYLSHVVKDVTGRTAGEWIDDYVALEAKALLKSTNMTIQQIADELNFPSQSFFGKFFKRVVGVAPKYYR